MTGQDLWKSILRHAISGKLVPQDPRDEPASHLLDKIAKEKKQLLKEGKLKKRDLASSTIYRGDDGLFYERVGKRITCIQDQIPFDIPDSWCWVRLGQIFNVVMGQSPEGASVSKGGDGMEFHQGKIAFGDKVIGASSYFTSSPRKVAPKNSLLLCVRAPVGLVNITDRNICIGRGLCSLKPVAGDVSFYFWFFHPLVPIFESRSSGSTFKSITLKVVENQLFPLPPEGEQERIVERLEEMKELVDVYGRAYAKREALDADLRPSLRRGVLEEAISGRLVEQRSEEGSAEPLLTQIEQEKKQLLKAGKLKKRDLISSTIYRGDDELYYERVGKRITCIQDQIPFDIPSSWRWVRLGQIYKTTSGGTPRKRPEYYDGDIPWFRSGEIGEKYISHSEVRISEEAIANSSAKIFPAGSLLVTMYCETMGQASILKVDAATNQAICALNTCDIQSVNTLYLYYFFHGFRTRYQRIGFGSAQPNISQTVIRNTLFPLPPEGEQERIVERLDKLMAQIDRL